ncbi:unnamed protein product [Adineta steineri]|uniref:Uncharacterized protein n=1 Tax=Adineta steineri TaxID=433720 RepID=A0A815UE64_9BILA|nr:unnamed protein product [Adineta steineri]CAF1515760.1 unnamed protein product [Adineta steineri]CAF4198552.1 unnamed protein product [Adineta steineri]CAF4199588.1 unnamed protein product [Adineta steineri]
MEGGLGIEQSWEELKRDFNRIGPGCPSALYFKTISAEGPELFAVVNDNAVFYHDNGQWYRYITACNIKFGIIEANRSNMSCATNDETNVNLTIEEVDWVIISENK